MSWLYVDGQGMAFLAGSYGVLTDPDKAAFIHQIKNMFDQGIEEMDLVGEDFEGRATTDSKYFVLGNYGGLRYDCVVETDAGKHKLSFLISEPRPEQMH